MMIITHIMLMAVIPVAQIHNFVMGMVVIDTLGCVLRHDLGDGDGGKRNRIGTRSLSE